MYIFILQHAWFSPVLSTNHYSDYLLFTEISLFSYCCAQDQGQHFRTRNSEEFNRENKCDTLTNADENMKGRGENHRSKRIETNT